MKYFESFPRIIYTFDKDVENQQLVIDIFARSAFLRDVANNTSIAYDYLIQDSDTPEIVADKFYGDPYKNWIILLLNSIINPYYDWPLKNNDLDNYVVKKYGGTLEDSKITIHHYEKEVLQTASNNGVILEQNTQIFNVSTYDYNQNTGALILNTLPGTADTSLVVSTETYNYNTYILSITTTHRAVSNYNYEFNENEKKRKIRILQEFYVDRVETEFREIMRNG